MDILPLIKRLISAEPKHFGWSVMTSSGGPNGLRNKIDVFVIGFAQTAKVFEISKNDLEIYLDDIDESDLIYAVLRVASECNLRVLLWEEKISQEIIYFARIWKPNKSSQHVKEVKGNDIFITICLAYLSNYE